MGNNRAEAVLTSRSKQNYIHINYRITILQTEISDSYMLEGNVTRSIFYFFILHLIVYQVQCCVRTRLDTHTFNVTCEFWGALASLQQRLIASSCLPVRSHGRTRLPLHVDVLVVSWNFTLRAFVNTEWSKSICSPDSVYSNNPHTIDDLKMAVTEHIRNVDRAILNTVF